MCLVLSGLELAYGSANRILLATQANRYGGSSAWARRGVDGIRTRSSGFLQLGQTVATELRTLGVSSPKECQEILKLLKC